MFDLNLKMAWLNIWRRKIRSALVIVMIGVSMSVMLAIQGLYDGMTQHMIESTLRSESGEVTLYAPSYRLHQNIKYRIGDTETVKRELQRVPEVTAVCERIRLTGLASTAHKSAMAKLTGIDIDAENLFGDFQNFIVVGDLSFGEDDNGAVIGKKLAQTLKLGIGSRVIFSAQDVHGELSSVSLRIKGIVQTTNPAIDDLALFVSLAKIRHLSGLREDESTELAVRIKEDSMPESVKRLFQEMLPSLDIYTWMELYPALEQMQVMTDVFNGISFGIVMVMVFIGILGVMFVSILERIREFGILLAIGEPYAYIRREVIFEALFLGVGGYLFGVLLGTAALYYLKLYGMDLSAFSAGLAEFGMNSVLYAAIKAHYFTTTFGAIALASLLSVVLPLRKLKTLKPIDVIQGG